MMRTAVRVAATAVAAMAAVLTVGSLAPAATRPPAPCAPVVVRRPLGAAMTLHACAANSNLRPGG